MKRIRQNLGLPARWRYRYGVYWYRVPVDVRHLWDDKTEFRLGATLPEAFRVYAERLGSAEALRPVTMDELSDRYQLQVVPTKRPATQRSNLISLGYIRSAFGANPVDAIQPPHIYQFRDALAAQKSKKVANLALEVLSHMFTKSIEWGSRVDHPMTGKKVVKFGLSARSRYVTDAELFAFAEVLPEYWRLYVSLKLHLGLSKGDLLSIRYSDLSANSLTVTRRKTGKVTVYTLSPSAMSIIHALRDFGRSDTYLFATSKGQPYIKPDGNTSGFDSI